MLNCPTLIINLSSGHAPFVRLAVPIIIGRKSHKLILDMFKLDQIGTTAAASHKQLSCDAPVKHMASTRYPILQNEPNIHPAVALVLCWAQSPIVHHVAHKSASGQLMNE